MKKTMIITFLVAALIGCTNNPNKKEILQEVLSLFQSEMKTEYLLHTVDVKVKMKKDLPKVTLSLCSSEEIDLLKARLLIHKVAHGLKERCKMHCDQVSMEDLEVSISFIHPENRDKKGGKILFVSLLSGKVYYTTYSQQEEELFDFLSEELTIY